MMHLAMEDDDDDDFEAQNTYHIHNPVMHTHNLILIFSLTLGDRKKKHD